MKTSTGLLSKGVLVEGLKRSKLVKAIRAYAWMRNKGGYIDTASYYFARPDDESTLKSRLNHCQHTWLQEVKGDKSRWRGIGCGIREVCPVCGAYVQTELAKEAVASVVALEDGIEIGAGLKLESFGLKLVLTISKSLSVILDRLLFSCAARARDKTVDLELSKEAVARIVTECTKPWRKMVDRLFEVGRKFVERWFGKGAGGVMGLQYTGESAPTEPHYHLHVFVLPAVFVPRAKVKEPKVKGEKRVRLAPVYVEAHWEALPKWADEARLKGMRESWSALASGAFNFEVKENMSYGYLGTRGKLNHNLHYLFRHSLADLWAGWSGVGDGEVMYKYKEAHKEVVLFLGPGEMANLATRMASIPAHFKRIRWFGIMADGVRGRTMRSVCLEPVNVKEDEELVGGVVEKWVKTEESARFVRYVDEGVLLRKVMREDDGTVQRERLDDIDGWPVWREVLGPVFLVPELMVDYRPSGVTLGKRMRWRTPGSGPVKVVGSSGNMKQGVSNERSE